MSEKITVSLIRCFEGERHERLHRIWAAFEEYNRGYYRFVHLHNPRCVWSHEQALGMIWARERKASGRYLVITEYDFLPDFENFVPVHRLGKKAVLCAEYVDGVGRKKPDPQWLPGAWYILIDKERAGHLDFSSGGPFHDPAFGLDAALLPATPMYPAYPGASYESGEHLFWQRHLHDDPEICVGREQMNLGWMQKRHDRRVGEWVRAAPKAYRKILAKLEEES